MELLSKYNEHKNKIISKDNRQFLLTEVYKKEKSLGKIMLTNNTPKMKCKR